MEHETAQRVWAAGAYKGLTPPKLAAALGVSVDTLKRTVRGERSMRAFESEESFLRRVAEECGLPYEFFTVDFAALARPDIEAARQVELLKGIEALLKEAAQNLTEQVSAESGSDPRNVSTRLPAGRGQSQEARAADEPSTREGEQKRPA